MEKFDTLEDPHRLIRKMLAMTINPHSGCGFIAANGGQLNQHPGLMECIHLSHLFQESGHKVFTKEWLLPDMMLTCRERAALLA